MISQEVLRLAPKIVLQCQRLAFGALQDGTTGLEGAPLNDLEKAAAAPTQVQSRMADVEVKRAAAATPSDPVCVLPKPGNSPRAKAISKQQVPPPRPPSPQTFANTSMQSSVPCHSLRL